MPAGPGASFSVQDAAGATIFAVQHEATAGDWDHWDGRQVFNLGDFLSYTVSNTLLPGTNCSLRVSGYVLTLP